MIWRRKTSSIDRLERIILVRKFGKMQVIGTLKSLWRARNEGWIGVYTRENGRRRNPGSEEREMEQ